MVQQVIYKFIGINKSKTLDLKSLDLLLCFRASRDVCNREKHVFAIKGSLINKTVDVHKHFCEKWN
jgi:hypothetical protein